MKYVFPIVFSLFFYLPNIVLGETWHCSYVVHGAPKITSFERTKGGFLWRGSTTTPQRSISETEENIILENHYSESIFIVILDKKVKEFLMTSIHSPAKLGRVGFDFNIENFKINHGPCEVIRREEVNR
jgi:hypothetical protein